MLLVSLIGTFAPTVLFEMYAKIPIVSDFYDRTYLVIEHCVQLCTACQYLPSQHDLNVQCQSCHYKRTDVAHDKVLCHQPGHSITLCSKVYENNVQPFLLTCGAMLPVAPFFI